MSQLKIEPGMMLKNIEELTKDLIDAQRYLWLRSKYLPADNQKPLPGIYAGLNRDTLIAASSFDEAVTDEMYARGIQSEHIYQANLYAERYQWLRSKQVPAEKNCGIFVGEIPGVVSLTGENLDAAIDAEMIHASKSSGPLKRALEAVTGIYMPAGWLFMSGVSQSQELSPKGHQLLVEWVTDIIQHEGYPNSTEWLIGIADRIAAMNGVYEMLIPRTYVVSFAGVDGEAINVSDIGESLMQVVSSLDASSWAVECIQDAVIGQPVQSREPIFF